LFVCLFVCFGTDGRAESYHGFSLSKETGQAAGFARTALGLSPVLTPRGCGAACFLPPPFAAGFAADFAAGFATGFERFADGAVALLALLPCLAVAPRPRFLLLGTTSGTSLSSSSSPSLLPSCGICMRLGLVIFVDLVWSNGKTSDSRCLQQRLAGWSHAVGASSHASMLQLMLRLSGCAGFRASTLAMPYVSHVR